MPMGAEVPAHVVLQLRDLLLLFAYFGAPSGAETAGAILKYVGLPPPGCEETASGDQIVDPNE